MDWLMFDHMTSVFSRQTPSRAGFARCFRKAITTLAFSPDGKYMVTGEVGLWSWSPSSCWPDGRNEKIGTFRVVLN